MSRMIFILASMLHLVTAPVAHMIPKPLQQPENMWLALANATGQQHMRISMDSAGDPLGTCFIGAPIDPKEMKTRLKGYYGALNETCQISGSDCICICTGSGKDLAWPSLQHSCTLRAMIEALNVSATYEPQEINLLWSIPPGIEEKITHLPNCSTLRDPQLYNSTGVVVFGKPEYFYKGVPLAPPKWQQYTNVSGTTQIWNLPLKYGFVPNITEGAKALPPGIFLVCENKAFNAIPW